MRPGMICSGWTNSLSGFVSSSCPVGELDGLARPSTSGRRRPRPSRSPRARWVGVPELTPTPSAASVEQHDAQADRQSDNGRLEIDTEQEQEVSAADDAPHHLQYEQVERGSTPDDEMRLQGRVSEEKGNLEDAAAQYLACTAMNKHNGKGWQDLAKLKARQSGSVFAAIDVIDEALTFNYENPFLWQTLGLLHSRTRNIVKARECFRTGLDVDKMHAPLYSAWGRVEALAGNIAQAREIFERGAERGLNCVRLYHTWGVMEQKFGSLELALELFDKGLQIEPENKYVWQSVGNIAMGQSEFDRARFCFQQALRNDPDNVVVLEVWGRLETRVGNFEQGRELFRRAEKAGDGKDARLFQSWSVLESIQGNHLVARNLAERALQIKPTDSILWHRIASCEADLGNHPKARALFKKGASCNPRDWKLWETWSAMEWRCGNREISTKLSERSFAIRYNVEGDFVLLASSVNDRRHYDLLDNLVRRRGATSDWASRNAKGRRDEKD